jgi:hypothetical protein
MGMLSREKADHLRYWLTYAIHSPVYAVDTFSAIATRIAVALVDVDLTVGSRGARLAAALVAINEVLTMAAKLAGVALTLVDLCLAEVASKTWVTVASERVLSIDTLPSMTRGTLAVIYVRFAVGA